MSRYLQRISNVKSKLAVDGFHDHGTWTPPCSKERHHMITHGKPLDKDGKQSEDYEDKLYRALTSTKQLSDGSVFCICCRSNLTFITD